MTQIHEVRASAHTVQGATNPELMIMALVARAADAMVRTAGRVP